MKHISTIVISFSLLSLILFTGAINSVILFNDSPIPVMSSGTPIPAGTRYPSAAGFTRNDSAWIYVMGGLLDGNIITANCYKYNVRADTWETISPLSMGYIWIASAVRLGNRIYNMGGTNTLALNEAQTRVQILDVNSNTWSTGTPLPFGRVFMGATAYQDSLIYIAGGWGYPGWTTYNDVYVFNSYTNTWRPASSMNAPRCAGVLAVSNDTLVYACGGMNWTNPSATNIVYRGVISQTDRSVISWDTAGAVYPPGPRNSIYGASWGSSGIIVSGGYSFQSSGATNNCYVFNPGRNEWTLQPNLLSTRTDHGAASVNMGNIWKFINITGTSNRSSANLTTVNILTDTLPTIVNIEPISKNSPSEFKLSQNYPNPFNPSTKFTFDIPAYLSNVDVRIIVNDVTGKLVSILSNGRYKPGRYEVVFNAFEYTSGIYFYSVIADANGRIYKETKKMVLVK